MRKKALAGIEEDKSSGRWSSTRRQLKTARSQAVSAPRGTGQTVSAFNKETTVDEHEFGPAIARADQAQAEQEAEARSFGLALAELRRRLIAGGYTPHEAFKLAAQWANERLYRSLNETTLGDW